MVTPAEPKATAHDPLDGAVIVLGVTGSIAAYKAVEICRRLVDAKCHVVPVLTRAAMRFIGTPTFSALASEPAKTDLFDDVDPIPHTRLGRRADLVLIAPASATSIARFAHGLGEDLLSATVLCTTAPVVLCPAMHTEMWQHPSVQENLATLERRGMVVVPPEKGRLAGGDVGEGRLADIATIVDAVAARLSRRDDLRGVEVVVTAGGTREPIDPVRYISNRSSGKQGYAIAHQAARRGANVTLISTVDLPVTAPMTLVSVETAAEMHRAVNDASQCADVVVMAAAVADFRPREAAGEKLKKRDGIPEIAFEPTEDILAGLSSRRREGQILVGFAAETTEPEKEALRKLEQKGVDVVVLNDVTKPGVGFAHDTNAVTILAKDGRRTEVPLASKSTIADAVLDEIVCQRTATFGQGSAR